MSQQKRIVIGIVSITLIVLTSYSVEWTVKARGINSGAIIEVSQDKEAKAFLSIAALQQLSGQSEGISNEDGLPLKRALLAAGVNAYEEVEVIGLLSDDMAVIGSDSVNKGKDYLKFNKKGRVDLVSIDNKERIIVADVSRIDIHKGKR